MEEGKNELMPGNAKHLCSEMNLEELIYLRTTMNIWKELIKKRHLCEKKMGIKFCTKDRSV